MSTSEEVKAALERVDLAIKEYAQVRENHDEHGEGRQIILTSAVVLYEQCYFEGDDTFYAAMYAFPQPLSMSAGLGVCHLGIDKVEQDLLGPNADED